MSHPRVAPDTPEVILAAIAVVLMVVRFPLPWVIPSNVLIGMLFLPMAVRYLRRYVGGVAIAVISIVPAITGLLLAAMAPPDRGVLIPILAAETVRVLGVGVVLAVLLWARSIIGLRTTIMFFAIGGLLNLLVVGVNPANIWKFSLSLPITLLVLSLPWIYGRRVPQVLASLGLAAVCIIFDSRSAAGFMLIAMALTLTQTPRAKQRVVRRSTAGRRWTIVVRFAAIGLAAFFLLQGAILEGLLGEETQQRTEIQIDTGGSVITGGRPELGASVALLLKQPWGYGAGVVPNRADVLTAQAGMARLGYDPNNGYVTNYMFGQGFEVHSVIGDMWILYGLGGVALLIVLIPAMIRGLAHSMALGAAATVMVYLVTRSIWDLGFSPFETSFVILPLTLAAVLEDRRERPPFT